MKRQPDFRIPETDLARQAVQALRGCAYQLYASADAWLSLSDDETLLIEVAEDFAIAAGDALRAVQVKNTVRTITFRSESVIEAINAFWRFRTTNPTSHIQLTFLSTSSIARERNIRFWRGLAGLAFWREAAKTKIDLTDLRKFLITMPLSSDLKNWLHTAPDNEIRDELLRPITWQCGALALAPLVHSVTNKVTTLVEKFGSLPSEAARALDAIIIELLMIAAAPGDRSVDRSRLLEIVERTTAVPVPAVLVRRSLSVIGRSDFDIYKPPLQLRQRSGRDDNIFFFAAKRRLPFVGRQHELARLEKWLGSANNFSWTLLTGAGGVGKVVWRWNCAYMPKGAAGMRDFFPAVLSRPILVNSFDFDLSAPL